MEKLKIEYIPISDIVPYEGNPRKNDKAVDVVMKSIKNYGFLVPVILDNKNCIVAGHTRVKAAIKLGMSEVPCIYAEGLTEAQIKAFRIMDNKSSEYATWNMELLKEELNDLKNLNFDLDLTGLNEFDLNKLYPENLEEKEIDEKIPKYSVQLGEVYQLGNNKIMCGDATKQEDVEKLMSNEKAVICLTDPPYSVDYKSRKEITDNILDSYQDPKDPDELVYGFLKIMPTDILIMSYAERHMPQLFKSYEKTGLEHRRMLIWKKQHFTFHMGSDYNNLYEPIFIAKKPNAKLIVNTDATITDVFEIDRKMKNNIHPTEKPLELYEKLMIYHSNKGDLIYEPFAGSGTTLIAAQKNERRCYAMEISPLFVSVIIERWENMTNQTHIKL
jgi:DNA modification methylase